MCRVWTMICASAHERGNLCVFYMFLEVCKRLGSGVGLLQDCPARTTDPLRRHLLACNVTARGRPSKGAVCVCV